MDMLVLSVVSVVTNCLLIYWAWFFCREINRLQVQIYKMGHQVMCLEINNEL